MTGGAESFAVAVANQLVQRGHRLTIVACDGSGSPGLDLHAAPHSQWPELVAKLGPDITLDWGLNIPAAVHRLGGGVHRALIGRELIPPLNLHLDRPMLPKIPAEHLMRPDADVAQTGILFPDRFVQHRETAPRPR